MKIRYKATGFELEVTKPLHPRPYYLTHGGSMIHVDDPQWELVKEEEWEDVTEECRVGSTGLLDTPVVLIVGKHTHLIEKLGYRLRKIDGLHHGPAFIVEKRKGF